MEKQPKFVISGGGTGGHIFPAIAIADTLKQRFPKADILFIGAKGRMEMERVPRAGYPIEGLWISGWTKSIKDITLPFKLISSLGKARRILKQFQPDVVVGVGGYASAAALKMASRMSIPTVLQEQNSIPGKTNQYLGKQAKAVCVAYPNMEQWFPKDRIVYTGNPLRSNVVANASKDEAARYFHLDPNKPVALLIGGSQGSRDMNYGVLAKLSEFKVRDTQFIWQTGKDRINNGTMFIDMAQEKVNALGLQDQVKPTVFIDRMDLAYSLADVVISRAGAMSISELSLMQKPVIFVPLPSAEKDHQTKNAMTLVNAGAAIIVKNENVNEELVPTLFRLCDDPEKQASMKANIAQFARPNAASDIVEVVVNNMVCCV